MSDKIDKKSKDVKESDSEKIDINDYVDIEKAEKFIDERDKLYESKEENIKSIYKNNLSLVLHMINCRFDDLEELIKKSGKTNFVLEDLSIEIKIGKLIVEE